jgi:hypothetical protein
VLHGEGPHSQGPDVERDTGLVLEEVDRESEIGSSAGEEHAKRGVQEVRHAGRSGNRERIRSLAQFRFDQKERQTAEMVGVEMRDQHSLNGQRLDAEPFHAGKGGSAAVEEKPGPVSGDVNTGVKPASAAECIPRADEREC